MHKWKWLSERSFERRECRCVFIRKRLYTNTSKKTWKDERKIRQTHLCSDFCMTGRTVRHERAVVPPMQFGLRECHTSASKMPHLSLLQLWHFSPRSVVLHPMKGGITSHEVWCFIPRSVALESVSPANLFPYIWLFPSAVLRDLDSESSRYANWAYAKD